MRCSLNDNGITSHGAAAFAEALPANVTLKTLSCVVLRRRGGAKRPVTLHRATVFTRANLHSSCVRSPIRHRLSDNKIKSDAGLLLADALKVNIGVTKLKCVLPVMC